ncbi:putative phloem protein [Helianthus annuus]|uniref:Phloem protein n=1 Tax=Helianthus annuus TaxID=4232 RepID=A0A251TU88_HELAN|nr:putative F-box protein PP2-B2 [Helianthus annuus]KAF5812818.1 putative phloem protein [Helianthus annuus]KAJ0606632.1 putative phloem protein [Helianthus annuus]KAJ0933968.1 putative phloem protein [Helianthus annuus]
MNEATTISALDAGCLSCILSFTTPRDACRAATISKGFNSVADSDSVWEWFLPPDYREVIARAVSPVAFESKKKLYHQLSDTHILLDGGRLSFNLDKESGKKCYMMRARDLHIAWENDDRYWIWGHLPESRFEEVAMLKTVCWLDIRGVLATSTLSPKTIYSAYLVYRITRFSEELYVPGEAKIMFGGVVTVTRGVYLQQPHTHAQAQVIPSTRKDGWIEVKLGEFNNNDGDEGEVRVAFTKHETFWKTGLILEGIEFRPK